LERRSDESIYELLQHELYTPEEVARLLGIGVHVVEHAAFSGELRAQIAGHDITSIRREDVIAWYEREQGTRRGES
jgi:excisionase family DNA binding protein